MDHGIWCAPSIAQAASTETLVAVPDFFVAELHPTRRGKDDDDAIASRTGHGWWLINVVHVCGHMHLHVHVCACVHMMMMMKMMLVIDDDDER